MNNCIYKITNVVNGKFYIGSAADPKNRFSTHVSQLNNGIHHNKHLQKAWNKYGKENFTFEVIEQVSKKELLLEREQFYIDTFKPQYNICKVAGNTAGRIHNSSTRKKISDNHADVSGENNPMYGKKGILSPNYGKNHKQDTKDKIRDAIGDRSRENNPMYGKKHSQQTKDKMRERMRENKFVKLNIEIVRQIRQEYILFKDINSLASKYNVCSVTIRNIINNKTWKDTTENDKN